MKNSLNISKSFLNFPLRGLSKQNEINTTMLSKLMRMICKPPWLFSSKAIETKVILLN